MEQTKEELWAIAVEYFKLKLEGKNPVAQYFNELTNKWIDVVNPSFSDFGYQCRIKPELVQHKGGEYPAPCTDAEKVLEAGGAYIPDLSSSNAGELFADTYYVMSRNIDRAQKLVDSNLAYINKEDAIARAKVIYEID